MSYVIPDDTTSWNVERVVEFTSPSVNDIIWDGRFVITSTNSSINLYPYELLDRTHMDEISLIAGAVGVPIQNEYLNQISEPIQITSLGGYWLQSYNNGFFVTDSKYDFTTIKFYDYLTEEVEVIDTPTIDGIRVEMNSNILLCNGKLWVSDTKNGGNRLHLYDVNTKIWSNSIIPIREQVEIRHISHDKNNHVLITNFNDWSVCKYTIDGTYIEKVMLDDSGRNKEPSFIYTDEDKNTFIVSFNGMISKFNTTTNSIDHFSYIGKASHTYQTQFWGLESDGTYIWLSTNGNVLNRIKISDISVVGTEFGDPPVLPDLTYQVDEYLMSVSIIKPSTDTVMESGYYLNKAWSPSSWKKVIIVPQMTKQVWNGTSFDTKTYQSHVCVIHNSGMFAFPNIALWRPNFIEVGSTAMISSGPYDYTGD